MGEVAFLHNSRTNIKKVENSFFFEDNVITWGKSFLNAGASLSLLRSSSTLRVHFVFAIRNRIFLLHKVSRNIEKFAVSNRTHTGLYFM